MESRGNHLVVIGAGAAGLMAAISAARCGVDVIILEKMERAGRKLLITGKGRCNITNTKPWSDFSNHIYPNSNFLKSSFFAFSNKDTINFFEEIGLETVIERGDRVFPASGKAQSVVDALCDELKRLGVTIYCKERVSELQTGNRSVIKIVTDKREIHPAAVIVATGGLSYPATGSTGDGYLFAKQSGHTVEECLPSLTALMPESYDSSLEGLLVKNVEISLYVGKEEVQNERGDIEFTNNGLEGPLGFRISRKAVNAMINGSKCSVIIDLKPALSREQVVNRILRELADEKVNTPEILLKRVLPTQLSYLFLKQYNDIAYLPKDKSSRLYAEKLADLLKNWILNISSFTSYERAVITAGGVSLKDIYPKKMQSRIIDNLFFAGEVLNIDGDTGGYNLQIAFSTGFAAGKEAAHLMLSLKI